ncbi:hypothetical protein D3H65_14980 [Paraflavitalea soli]|uniref:Uncharacterized protein n=1 Tax=Paraflavitalea soli TaxID=2315862 RepID=A0A3B7MQF3_9BACT|nr:hypothetical protein [Paraflavitalea soli]AXY75206.1 hypothetical protein D3H65_14980 [Paraflavitalea soli]
MNYAKVIGSALQLFPKKIKVTLIDAVTGKSLGKHTIPAAQLPGAFNRPTILNIDNSNWRVLKADPILADDFLFSKRLMLEVRRADSADALELKFNLPSICKELPVTGADSLFQAFTLELDQDDWRQVEFLPLSRSGEIEEAIKLIEAILTGQPNPLLGYEQQYSRHDAGQPGLSIPWDAFCGLVPNPVLGNVALANNELVQDGFAIRSEGYTYYGIVREGLIQTLCLTQFDSADDEFMQVISTFQLTMVDWCGARRMSAEVGEKPKSEFIEI